MRISVSSVITVAAMAFFSFSSYGAEKIAVSDDDGTYKTISVESAKECTKLCEKDNDVCRGSMLIEQISMINGKRSSTFECRLNNGLSSTSPFEVTPPEPLDFDLATAELNAYRAANGLSPVTLNKKLNRASDVHAKDLAKNGIAAHVGSDGSTHSDRVQRENYYFTTVAENVATGQKSWDEVFQAWKDSPGHDANLLADGVTDFGIALIYEPTTTYITYWTMLVGAPMPNFKHPANAITVEQKAMLNAQETR